MWDWLGLDGKWVGRKVIRDIYGFCWSRLKMDFGVILRDGSDLGFLGVFGLGGGLKWLIVKFK